MLKKAKFISITIWLIIVRIISPTWIGIIYMNITGHAKGYGYDMGPDAEVAVFLGIIELGLWIVSIFPAMIFMSKKCYNIKKVYIFIPLICFIILFTVGIFFISWNEFIKAFGFGY